MTLRSGMIAAAEQGRRRARAEHLQGESWAGAQRQAGQGGWPHASGQLIHAGAWGHCVAWRRRHAGVHGQPVGRGLDVQAGANGGHLGGDACTPPGRRAGWDLLCRGCPGTCALLNKLAFLHPVRPAPHLRSWSSARPRQERARPCAAWCNTRPGLPPTERRPRRPPRHLRHVRMGGGT